jgi:hypothetical protein
MKGKLVNLDDNLGKKSAWAELKHQLTKFSQHELLALISELYSLSTDNKRFVEAKVINDDSIIEKYRAIINKNISTDTPWKKSQQLSLKTAKKAISDYKKATGNIIGTIDLMIEYVECGTDFTCAFGDIDENFYSSLELVFGESIKLMSKHGYNDDFITRLSEVVNDANDIGWGYYDTINDMWQEWLKSHNYKK